MLEPAVPPDEASRLAALRGLGILDTPPEERFDRLTRLAQRILNVPIAVVSLVDDNRQWFKSCQGLDARETPRNISFCGHAILDDRLFVIPDASLDPRFADNPLVAGAPYIRFYAGQPLKSLDGSRLGTLCAIDTKPHQMTRDEQDSLRDLALLVENELNVLDSNEATHALLDSEKRLAAVLDNILDGIITINEHGIVDTFNQSAERIFGYRADEVAGRNINMLMPEPYHAEHDGYLNNYTATGRRKVIDIGREVVGKRKDGTTFPMDLAVSEMWVENQRIFTGIVRDLTQRKQIDRQQAQFAAIVNSSTDAIMSKSLDGVVTSWNPGAERMFGYTEQEMVGRPMASLIPADRADEEPRILAKITHGEYIEHFETVRKRKSGEIFSVSINISPIKDRAGFIVGASTIVRDISDRKKREEELDNANRLSRAVVDGADHLIITTDTNGVILSFNHAAEASLGYRAKELVGKLTPAVFHDIDEVIRRAHVLTASGLPVEPGFEVFVAHARQKNTGDTHIWTYVRKDGSRFPVSLTVSALRDSDGKIYAFLGIATDITERVKIERMKSEFISTVSHELRTPLTSIRGSLGLVVGGVAGELPVKAKGMVDIAYKNCERLILLVNDILDTEKIEAGKMEFHFQPVHLTPVLRQAIESNRAYAAQFQVSYELANELPEVVVNVDANRLMQVLTNLLSNAAKFSPDGGRVLVSAQPQDSSIRVTITDHGVGITEEFKGRIFQKFSQADASDARKKGGTGLGLSITKAIVEAMGGKIGFDSQPGVQTSFYVEFPVMQGEAHPSVTTGVDEAGKRVLICEDDRDIAALLGLMMQQLGVVTDIAYDAAGAKRLLSQHRYAAMTLDLGLPDQSGISLIRELRQNETTLELPILVVSANAQQGSMELSGEAFNVVDWLSKPIDQARLGHALHKALQRVSGARPSILHVEDDPDVVQVVRSIVGEHAEIASIGTLAGARRMLQNGRYDLVILDLTLSDGAGIELMPSLTGAKPPVPVMIFSAQDVKGEQVSGVSANLLKSRANNEQLLAIIKRLLGIG